MRRLALVVLLCAGAARAELPVGQLSRDQLGRTFTPVPGVSERPEPRTGRNPGAIPRADVERAVVAADAAAADAPAEPDLSPEVTPEALDALHVLRDRGVAVPLVDAFLRAGTALDRTLRDDVTADGAPALAAYAPGMLDLSSTLFDERGRWLPSPPATALADLAAAVWRAYVDQVVRTGGDPETRAALDAATRWIVRARRVEVQGAPRSEPFPLPPELAVAVPARTDPARLAESYAAGLVRALVRDPAHVRAVRCSDGARRAVEVRAAPPPALRDRIIGLLGKRGLP